MLNVAGFPPPSTPFEELPEALKREVIGRIVRFTLIGVACVLSGAFLFGLAVAIGVGVREPWSWTVGVVIGAAILVWAFPLVLSLLLLVRGLGGWPGVLSNQRLCAMYGVDLAHFSNAAYRSQIGNPEYWWHGLAGMAMTSGMAAISSLIWQNLSGRPFGPLGATICVGLLGFAVMIRAWQIRRLVNLQATDKGLISPVMEI